MLIRPPNLVVADFGCGDAKLAQAVPQKVHSFDLVALNPRVKACDMSNVSCGVGQVSLAKCENVLLFFSINNCSIY